MSDKLQIPIDQIAPSPFNRKVTKDDALKQLAASITQHGIIQSLVLRPSPNGAGTKYQLVCGERRWRAGILAKLSTVPAEVRELTDAEVIEIQAVENAHREDATVFDKLNSYEQLLKLGKTVKEVCLAVSEPESTVYGVLSLKKCSEEVRLAVLEGKITQSHAVELASLTIEQQEKWCDNIIDDNLSVRDLQRELKEAEFIPLSRAGWKWTDAALVKKAGPCSACPKNSGVNLDLARTAGKNICTDPTCFEQKVEAFIEQRAKAGAVKLSGMYSPGALNNEQWEVSKSKKTGTLGVLVDGEKAGSVVWFDRVGKKKEVNTWARSQKRKVDKAKAERAWRRPVAEAVAAKVKTIGAVELALIEDVLVKGADQSLRAQLKEIRKKPLPARLVMMALDNQVNVTSWYQPAPKVLLSLARRYHVNVGAIKREALKPSKKEGKHAARK